MKDRRFLRGGRRMKRLAALVLACLLIPAALPLRAEAGDPGALSLTDYPTEIRHRVQAKGRYVNWAGVSSVSQFADEKGNFCFAADEGDSVTVYRTERGTVTGSTVIGNPYDSFGAALCGGDGSLYMVWGRNNPGSDCTEETIILGKYAPDGTLIASVGGNGSEGMPDYYGERFYTRTPFDSGNCDAAMNGDLVMVNYARHMYSGHQANTIFTVDTSTMTVRTGMTSYNSHSFDQRVTPCAGTGGFLLESQGDCFPRSFTTSVTDAGRVLGEMDTFSFWVEEGTYTNYDMRKLNATRARLGNILETSRGAALVAASARSLSEAAKNEPYDLFVQVFDPTGSAAFPETYVTAGERSGMAGNDGNTPTTDYGVQWLTDLAGTGRTVEEVQAVSAEDRIVVLYELYAGSAYESTQCMVLNADGSVLLEPFSLGAVRLNLSEDPVYADGAVQWVSNDPGSDLLTIRCLDVSGLDSGTLGSAGELAWPYLNGSLTVTGPVSGEAPAVAALYGPGGTLREVRIITGPGEVCSLPRRGEKLRLMWVNERWEPLCAPAEVHADAGWSRGNFPVPLPSNTP